ncbi:PREDICTED: uncharacterized protein LOC104802970 [Tarenaya hassleriana]|uniref:uncharacterized protein LOC104802970 n=1 Tax=Tarenaya hassleriana TaxID=28532 RepID=UPI00053C7C33|nr:PREDICTED: uncharacterized protein LOC104802970 [Tarenaya hassleriana]XP_010525115.1 PREDICTED: uncharacterized protein LOC104802970 [Tarenaya hassleriana]
MQQFGYDEMQLLQQQVLLKQLQVLQRQQLQQQNFLSPFSPAHRQANSGQFPPLIDGTSLGDASQGYINLPQRITSPAQQGTLNRTLFPIGLGSHQLDASLYGTPVANARGNMGQQSPMQAMYQDSGSLAAKISGQIQKPVSQLSDFSNSFLKDQYKFSPAQVSLPQGAFMSDLGFQGKGTPEAGPAYGLNIGLYSDNLVMGNSQQINTSSSTCSGRQEQVSWSSVQQTDAKPSQGLVPLDPLEEKILFNMEDSSISDIASGVFGDKYDDANFSNTFPSIQSGSWSALMQSAVAEASSSDTGVQDEFSGLTYQNMELSADNNITKFRDSDKQQAGWVNDSLPCSASFTSKSLEMDNNPDIGSSFPGFQMLSDQQRVGSCHGDGTPESTQRSSKVSGLPIGGYRQVQTGVQFDGTSAGKMHSAEILNQVHSRIGNLATCRDDSSANNLSGTSNSFQPLASALDLSQSGKWENVSGPLGRAGVFPSFIQQNDPATISASGALSERNESQVQMVHPLVASESDNANQMSTHSGLPGQDVTRQFNVWMDLPTRQHPRDQESSKVPLDTKSSADLLGGNVVSWQKSHVPSGAYNVPQRVGLPQFQGSKLVSGSIAANKDFPSVSLGCKPSEPVPQSYPSLNILQVANNADTDASKTGVNSDTGPTIQRGVGIFGQKLYEENSGLKVSMNSGMNSMAQLNQFASGDAKMNSMAEARKTQIEQIVPQNLLPGVCSSGMVSLAQWHSHNQCNGSSNVVASSLEHGRVHLPASTSISFKQIGALKNGEIQPVYDSKNIPIGNLSSVKHADVVPYTEQELSAQDVRSLDTMDQNMAMIISKKRKFMARPWHEEVTHVSKRHQTMSVAGQEWAQITNRLIEKGEYEIGEIESVQPFPRAKRRLVLTAQLMQQLFRPAPAFIFLSDVSSSYHSLLYFVARVNLGDACCLTYKGENGLPSSSNEVNKFPEKIETLKKRGDQQYLEVAKELTEKVKKVEGDFERLEKTASVAEIKFEIEDLERFAVINRFARFHSRAPQVNNSGNPSPPGVPKPIPQRYITAVLSPKTLPERVQCLSL